MTRKREYIRGLAVDFVDGGVQIENVIGTLKTGLSPSDFRKAFITLHDIAYEAAYEKARKDISEKVYDLIDKRSQSCSKR